jgi:hypothetical protein
MINAKKTTKKGTRFNKQTQILAYVDDIDIISWSQEAVRKAVLALQREK